MKQIFTLFIMGMLCLITSKSSAQITENFETPNNYTAWQFRGAAVTTTNSITGAGSLDIIPTTSGINTGNSNSGYAISPLYSFTQNSSITFSYLLHDNKWKASSLSANAIRRISVSFINAAGTVTQGPYVDLTPTSSASGIITMALPTMLVYPTLQKIQLEFLGNGDGNTSLAIDNMSISSASLPIAQSVLPVHITSITGNVNNGKAQLNWTAADNETGNYFEIQKSKDGKNFSTTFMFFNTEKAGIENYNFTDPSTLTNGTFYRLKIVNKDNSTSYSKVIYLKNMDATAGAKIILLQNPVQSTLSFSFAATATEPTEIAVYNMAGVKVYNQTITTQKGTNTMSIGVDNNLNKGNYILQVRGVSGRSNTQFVKL